MSVDRAADVAVSWVTISDRVSGLLDQHGECWVRVRAEKDGMVSVNPMSKEAAATVIISSYRQKGDVL